MLNVRLFVVLVLYFTKFTNKEDVAEVTTSVKGKGGEGYARLHKVCCDS